MVFPDLVVLGYTRDLANRQTDIGWHYHSGLFSQTYDSLGRLVSVGKNLGSTSYGYDAIGRLTSMGNDLAGAANDISWGFGYNPAGQMISMTSSSDVYDYEELTGITEPSQAHDGLNRISTLVGATGACPSGGYDARGNLICDGTGRSYAYDLENRLLTGNIAGNGLVMTYDPEGRLSSYSWNGSVVSFLYDGVNLVGEYNSSGTMLRRYIHGTGTDDPVIHLEGAGTNHRRYFYKNYQGSVIATADINSNRLDLYAYGPYGEPKDQYGFTFWPSVGVGFTNSSRFGYTGQMFLGDARLYYYKARVYDPQMGRFLQTDPIGSEDDLNLYAYVSGDPVNQSDTLGLMAEDGSTSNECAEKQDCQEEQQDCQEQADDSCTVVIHANREDLIVYPNSRSASEGDVVVISGKRRRGPIGRPNGQGRDGNDPDYMLDLQMCEAAFPNPFGNPFDKRGIAICYGSAGDRAADRAAGRAPRPLAGVDYPLRDLERQYGRRGSGGNWFIPIIPAPGGIPIPVIP